MFFRGYEVLRKKVKDKKFIESLLEKKGKKGKKGVPLSETKKK